MIRWQEKIISRLNIENSISTIVIDNTAVLSTDDFKKVLKDKIADFCYVKHGTELVSAVNRNTNLIITTGINIPSFVQNRCTVLDFTYNQLPVECETAVFKRLNTEDLVNILYLSDKAAIPYLTESNMTEFVDAARGYFYDSRAKWSLEKAVRKAEELSTFNDVLEAGKLWGYYLYYSYKARRMPEISDLHQFDSSFDRFWDSQMFEDSFFVSDSNCATVNKVCSCIKSRNENKVALVCFDGMGFAEWLLLKSFLKGKGIFAFKERAVFSLIPSITMFARKSLFGAKYDDVFRCGNIDDARAFSGFFNGEDTAFFSENDTVTEEKLLGITHAGLLFNFFDDLGHNTVLPPGHTSKSVYFDNVVNYLNKSNVAEKLNILKENDYRIFFCSDHGNTLCRGNGQKIEKYLVDKKSRRATIGNESVLMENYDLRKIRIPFIDTVFAFLAKGRECFGTYGEMSISHGGLTLEEMVVPFVEVIS